MARKTIEKNIAYDDERKLYYVTMDYGKDEHGKRIKVTKTFKDKKSAKKALLEFGANKAKNNLVIPNSVLLSEWLNYWLNDIKSLKCEETTLYGYKKIIDNHIVPSLGQYKLQEITPQILNKYFKTKIELGLSKTTVRKHYDLLKDVFQQAIIEEKILKNPLDKIEPIKKEIKEMNYYTIEQLKQLFKIVENDRMEIVVKLAGMLGLRRSEIAGLKWDKINFENRTITISEARTQAGKETVVKGVKTKTSHRTLYIPEEIYNLLLKIKSYQEEQKNILKDNYIDQNYVIAWENGQPYRPNYLSDLFKKIITDNNLPPLRLHDLRHTFASIANELGISLYDISKTLGHSNVGTTSQIYTHVFDKTHKKTIDIIASKINTKN